MSQITYFDGVRLVKPGGASKIDASAFEAALAEGIGTMAIVGEATKGKPGEVIAFTSAAAMEKYFGSGPLAEAARIAFRPLNDDRVGARQATTVYAYKTNASTQATLTLKSGNDDALKLSAAEYGVDGNSIFAKVASAAEQRTFTIRQGQGATSVAETVVVPGLAKLSVKYIGSGSAPTVTIADANSDGVVESIALQATTATAAADDLTITFAASGVSTIKDLVDRINSLGVGKWTAAVVDELAQYRFSPAQLDTLAAVGVASGATAPTKLYGLLQDCIDSINAKSTLVVASVPATPAKRIVPDNLTTEAALSGGTLGGANDAAFLAAFAALEKIDSPHVVLAASADGVSPSSFTLSNVLSQLQDHCARMSAVGGKKERTGYGAIHGSKSVVKAQATALNSQHVMLFCQTWTGTDVLGAPKTYGEWAWAVAAASARAGMEPGEPLTWKYFAPTAISQDASWSPELDGDEMLLSGVAIAEQDRRGVRLVKGITTYTKMDNDVFTEESIITNVKAMSKAFRELLEVRYTGRKATPQMLLSIKADAVEFWSQMRTDGRIVDSISAGQITQLAYRKIEVRIVRDRVFVDVEISPVSGINFQLETIRLVPAVLSA